MNTNVRVGTKIQLFGFYTLGYANSDTSGVSSFALGFLRHQPGLRPRLIRRTPKVLPRRQYRFPLSDSLESIHGDQFRIAIYHDLTDR